MKEEQRDGPSDIAQLVHEKNLVVTKAIDLKAGRQCTVLWKLIQGGFGFPPVKPVLPTSRQSFDVGQRCAPRPQLVDI